MPSRRASCRRGRSSARPTRATGGKQVVANKKAIVGRLNTLAHPDQMAYWVAAATTLSSNYLPSYSFEFFDSERVTRYLGGMVRSMTITSSADQDYNTISIDWIFQKLDATFTSFSQPAESNYSALVPYCHVETAGNVTLGGTAVAKYKTINITVNNTLAPTWDELSYITACYYCGRDADFQLGPQYTAVTYRTDFEAQTPLTFVLNWTRASPSHSLTFTMETASYIGNIDDSLPLDGAGYQNIGIQTFYDSSATADFAAAAS